jgi:uncharacterized paraquat-inducible protein A
MTCSRCRGTGVHRNADCPTCGATGWVSWEDVIVPWVVALLVAGVALAVGEWLWHLFAK